MHVCTFSHLPNTFTTQIYTIPICRYLSTTHRSNTHRITTRLNIKPVFDIVTLVRETKKVSINNVTMYIRTEIVEMRDPTLPSPNNTTTSYNLRPTSPYLPFLEPVPLRIPIISIFQYKTFCPKQKVRKGSTRR